MDLEKEDVNKPQPLPAATILPSDILKWQMVCAYQTLPQSNNQPRVCVFVLPEKKKKKRKNPPGLFDLIGISDLISSA